MKFKYILLALVAVLFFAAAFFYYQKAWGRAEADVWAFVPENAVLVYETAQAPLVWQELQQQPAGEILQALPHFEQLNRHKSFLDSILSDDLAGFLSERQLLLSLHVTGNNSFDYLFYFPLQEVKDESSLRELTDFFKKNPDYQHSTRTYHKREIEEVKHVASGKRFSYLLQNGVFLGSFTPFLLEDVIRQLDAPEEQMSFRKQHQALFQLTHLDADQGNLYVNGNRLTSFFNVFFKNAAIEEPLPYAAKMDVKLNQDGVLLNGYSVPENGEEAPYLQALLQEEPQELGVADLLPLKTTSLHFFGFENGASWQQKLVKAGAVPAWAALVEKHPEAAELPLLLGKRVLLARLESLRKEEKKLLYFHAPTESETAKKFKALALAASSAAGDSLFQEEFSGHSLIHLPYSQFPAALLGSAFAGFEECFYVQLGDYLILSNSMQELKMLLLDIENDNTWQKSLAVYQFLEKTNQEMNYGFYVNTERAWASLLSAAEPDWQAFLERYGMWLRQFNMMGVQLSSLDEGFYTNVFLQASPQQVQELKQIRLTILHESRLENPLGSRPILMQKSKEKGRQVLVQDTLNRLYWLDSQGDLLASDSLDAALVGEVFQLEPGKSDRLDFLAVSSQSLYLYNSAYQIKNGFPVSVPGQEFLQWANVIDYNGSRQYRILLAAASGNLFMFDLEGNNLEGWQPRELDGALSEPPGHLRVRGKDCIYAFQQKGTIQMLNRRGNSYKGFPLNLQESLLGPIFIQPGSDFENSLFTTITKGGELITFNLNGRITQQEQLFKPDVDADFRLVTEEFNAGFLILRQSSNRLSLLDEKGDLLFENDYLGAAKVQVQFFRFGTGNEIIAVTDPQEEFTFLYDRKGNLLNAEPLNSCCPISLLSQDGNGSYLIYKSFQDKVSVLTGTE